MKIYDLNCFTGSWPFHKLRLNLLNEMIKAHEKNGIIGGIVSSLEACFYNDPYEADLLLSEQIKGTNYKQYLTVNPLLIGYIDGVKRSLNEIHPMGVRIYPGFHGYSLNDEKLLKLCEVLKELSLPLVVTHRMEDERITYLLHPTIPSKEEWISFLNEQKDLKILITNIRSNEILNIKEAVLNRENVFFDASGINQTAFPFEHIVGEGFGEHIVYGSNMPLHSLSSSLLMIKKENIPEEIRERILNGKKFMDI